MSSDEEEASHMIVVGGIHRLGESLFFFFFVVKESTAFICRVSSKRMCSKYLKDLNSQVFRQAIFKIKNKGKYLKCVINSWILQIVQSFF